MAENISLKCIGLIGGLTSRPTAEYYRLINQATRDQLGDFYAARTLMIPVDASLIEQYQNRGQIGQALQIMIDAALRLERDGADVIIILSNSLHSMAYKLQERVAVPLLHIIEPTGQAIQKQGIVKIGLLCSAPSKDTDFYKARLQDQFELTVVAPNSIDQGIIDNIVGEQFAQGKVLAPSRQECKRILKDLIILGAQGIILGCTEMGLLVSQADSSVPLFDMMELHALAAAEQSVCN